MPATFTDHEIKAQLKDKRKLSTWLDALVMEHLEGIRKIKLNYIFCTDTYLLSINQQFLQHDTLTDIITFDLSEKENELVGEIYISVDRVKENANIFQAIYNTELHRVIFHGALHLCGFKDKTPTDERLMREMEQKCLDAYFLES